MYHFMCSQQTFQTPELASKWSEITILLGVGRTVSNDRAERYNRPLGIILVDRLYMWGEWRRSGRKHTRRHCSSAGRDDLFVGRLATTWQSPSYTNETSKETWSTPSVLLQQLPHPCNVLRWIDEMSASAVGVIAWLLSIQLYFVLDRYIMEFE